MHKNKSFIEQSPLCMTSAVVLCVHKTVRESGGSGVIVAFLLMICMFRGVYLKLGLETLNKGNKWARSENLEF